FKFPNDTTYQWKNTLGTLKWSHLFNNNFTGIATVIKSNYVNKVEGIAVGEEFALNSGIDLTQMKLDFGYFGLAKHQLDFGADASVYVIDPGKLVPYGSSSLNPRQLESDKGYETSVYLNDEMTLTDRLSMSVGLRFSQFAKIGPSDTYVYAEGQPKNDVNIVDTLSYGTGKVVQTYYGLEPRASFKYSLTD